MTLKPDSEQSKAVFAVLMSLRDLKRTQGFPCMPVAKFTHFFNPRLFPIYDYEVVWKKILDGAFRVGYRRWCTAIGRNAKTDIDSARLNLNYTLMAGDMIRMADQGFMNFFSQWFRQQVAGENDDYRVLDDMKSYYATAFEFVSIGAAHLDSTLENSTHDRRLAQSAAQNDAEKPMDDLLKTFERKLRDKGTSKGTIDTHSRRVSVYLRWCRELRRNPRKEDSAQAFLGSRGKKGNMITTIAAYNESVRVFLRTVKVE
jgi:hypothetical protein